MVSGDEWGTHGGRLTPGNIHTDAAGNVINPSEPSTALVPAKDEPPSVTAQDLAHLDSDAADIDAELDAEFAQRATAMRRAGFSDEEVRRLAGEPAGKAPSRASLETRLAEIRALRQTDMKRYLSAEIQAEELSLIASIEMGNAGATETDGEVEDDATEEEPEPTAAETKLAELQEELAAIQGLRKSDPKAYAKEETQARERELLGEIEATTLSIYFGEDVAPALRDRWQDQGGVEARAGAAAGMANLLRSSMSDEEAASFGAALDQLPPKVQVEIIDQFSVPGGSLTKKREAIDKALSGADLVAAQNFWDTWGEQITKGLVR